MYQQLQRQVAASCWCFISSSYFIIFHHPGSHSAGGLQCLCRRNGGCCHWGHQCLHFCLWLHRCWKDTFYAWPRGWSTASETGRCLLFLSVKATNYKNPDDLIWRSCFEMCLYLFMYVYMYILIYTHIYTYIHIFTHINTYI